MLAHAGPGTLQTSSIRLKNRSGLITIEAHEDVNHPAVRQDKFIINRIELRVKAHLLAASTHRRRITLNECRGASKLVTLSDSITCPLEFG